MIVKDANACTAFFTRDIKLSQPEQIIINNVTKIDATGCVSGKLGKITIDAQTASGSTASLEYSLDGTNWVLSNSFDVAGGNYTIYVRDNLNPNMLCYVTQNVTVFGPTLTFSFIINTPPTCYNGNDGSLGIIVKEPGPFDFSLNGGPSQTNSLFSNLTPGLYTVRVIDQSSKCEITTDVIVPHGPSLKVKLTVIDPIGLNKGSIQVNSIPGGINPYQISINNGVTWRTDSTFTNLLAGNYTLRVKDIHLCSFDTAFVVKKGPVLKVDTIITRITCYGLTDGAIGLRVDDADNVPPFTYKLDGPTPGEVTNTDQSYLFQNLSGGLYTITVINKNGAVYQDTITLKNPYQIIVNGKVTNAICNRYPKNMTKGRIDIAATGGMVPYTYFWSKDSTRSSITNVPVGAYSVTVTDKNKCSTDASFWIRSDTSVFAYAGFDTIVCPGIPAPLHALSNAKAFYTWSPDSGLNASQVQNPVATIYKQRTYKLMVSKYQCFDVDSVTIFVYPTYGLKASIDTLKIGYGLFAQLEAHPDTFKLYEWYPSTFIDNPFSRTITVNPLLSGKYTYFVTGTTKNGCFEKDTVIVIAGDNIKIPTGFTPNGDGNHDVWEIKGADFYPDIIVDVFNRWGSRVFQSKGYDNLNKVFDGKRNGHDLPVGTYYFIIDLKNGTDPINGTVTIIR